MTRDDIIRMAFEVSGGVLSYDAEGRWILSEQEVIQLAALAVAAEREACAKVCESLITDGDIYPGNFVLEACAKSIRSK